MNTSIKQVITIAAVLAAGTISAGSQPQEATVERAFTTLLTLATRPFAVIMEAMTRQPTNSVEWYKSMLNTDRSDIVWEKVTIQSLPEAHKKAVYTMVKATITALAEGRVSDTDTDIAKYVANDESYNGAITALNRAEIERIGTLHCNLEALQEIQKQLRSILLLKATLTVLLYQKLSAKRLSPKAFSEYTNAFTACGLTWAHADIYAPTA